MTQGRTSKRIRKGPSRAGNPEHGRGPGARLARPAHCVTMATATPARLLARSRPELLDKLGWHAPAILDLNALRLGPHANRC
jgi:hypothetical protein